MAKFKDFGVGLPAPEREQISFKLHGEELFCNSEIQGKILLDLVSKSGSDDAIEAAKVIGQFFKYVLLPDSYIKFDAIQSSTDKIVSIETMGEIAGWLVETYSDRPLPEPEASLPGA